MTNWPTAMLGDVADVNPRLRASLEPDQPVSFLGMADASDDGTTTAGVDRPFDDVRRGFTPFESGDILVAKITPCFQNGKIVQATTARPHGFGSTEFHVVRSKNDQLDHRYGLHFLRQAWIRIDGERRMTGSGGQRRVPADFLKSLTIPLPSIPEQRRIAAILDHADALRAKRREALARLDELTQSIFIDMFGDSRTIHTRWPRTALKDVLTDIESGRSPTCHARPASGEEYGVLKLGAVTYGVFDPSQNKALPEGIEPHTRYEVRAGDLLFTRKNTADLVGAAALVRETRAKLLLPDLIFRLRIDPESRMEPAYLQAAMMYPPIRRGIQVLAGGSAGSMPNISKAKLRTVDLPHPPAELQLAFARRVQSVERLKEDHRVALTELDALFASLQSRAFRGEL